MNRSSEGLQLNVWPIILTRTPDRSFIKVSLPVREFDNLLLLQEPEDSVFLTINRSAFMTTKWPPRCNLSSSSEKKKRHQGFSPRTLENGHWFVHSGSPVIGSRCLCDMNSKRIWINLFNPWLYFASKIFFPSLVLAGAACNKAPGLAQFHFMVSNSESGQPVLKSVDCFWTGHFPNEAFWMQ